VSLPATDWHQLEVEQGDTVWSSLARYPKKGAVCFGFVSFLAVLNASDRCHNGSPGG